MSREDTLADRVPRLAACLHHTSDALIPVLHREWERPFGGWREELIRGRFTTVDKQFGPGGYQRRDRAHHHFVWLWITDLGRSQLGLPNAGEPQGSRIFTGGGHSFYR